MAAWSNQINTIPLEWWLAGLSVLFVATAMGFVAGFACARLTERRAYERARSGLSQLFQTILQTLDTARELCGLLEKFPDQSLKSDETAQLELRRGGLFEMLSRIITRHSPAAAPAEPPPAKHGAVKVNWLMNPIDASTELPDRSAFESNISALLEACRASGGESSLLLVRVDKMAGLVARVGQANTEKLIKRLAHVVCRAVRDDDLVCRCNSETLGILFPGLDLEAAARQGRAIRDSVRNHHFHVEETGPELLLTASFGCTPCRPEENVELILNRAFDALSQSQRLGRNQLHVHNGQSLVHCAAG